MRDEYPDMPDFSGDPKLEGHTLSPEDFDRVKALLRGERAEPDDSSFFDLHTEIET